MNNKLFKLLNGLRPFQDVMQPQVNLIEKECSKITKKLGKYALKQPEILKQYAIHSFNKLLVKISEIETLSFELRSSIDRGMNYDQLVHIEKQLGYLQQILCTCTDLLVNLYEYLFAYYPSEYGTDEHRKQLKKLAPYSTVLIHSSSRQVLLSSAPPLSKIWLPTSPIALNEFLKLGTEKGIWNDQNQIIQKRNSLYGTGKSLLGNLSIALRGYAISENIDYKIVGKAFCETFQIEINENTKEKYKAFSSGNHKKIQLFKKAFNIH